jgi:MFS family permease
VLGALGVLLGGILASQLGCRDERWRLRVPAIACLLIGPAQLLFLLGNSRSVWLTGFALTSLFVLVHQGPVYAAAMHLATPRTRAVATSVILLCSSLFGQIFGPLLIGLLNDRLYATYGDSAIRYSMLITAVCPVVAGLAFFGAIRYGEGSLTQCEPGRSQA